MSLTHASWWSTSSIRIQSYSKKVLTYDGVFLVHINTRVISILRQDRNLFTESSVHAVRRRSLPAKMELVDKREDNNDSAKDRYGDRYELVQVECVRDLDSITIDALNQ